MSREVPNNPYINPQVAAWLDYLEGVPEPVYPSPIESSVEKAERRPWQKLLNERFEHLGLLLPGLVLALSLATLARIIARTTGEQLLGFDRSPVSAIFVVVLMGLGIRNLIGLPLIYSKGLQICLKRVLRIGIVMLGIRLSLMEAGRIGLIAIPVIVACIAVALVLVTWIGRVLNLPRRLVSLIAVGASICGVSAIAATGPAIEADEDEISYAVATVTLFGLMALVLHPFIAHWVFDGEPHLAGVFLGTAVHDTAQVAGSALIYEQHYDAPAALDYAVVTKLVRNLFMIAVIPFMALHYHRSRDAVGEGPSIAKLLPFFVFGFIGMMVLRTIGDMGERAFGIFDATTWNAIIRSVRIGADWCLVAAMAAVGLGTSLIRITALGWRPLLVGFAAAALVGLVSILLLRFVLSTSLV